MTPFARKYDEAFWDDFKNAIDWYDAISPNICNNFLAQFEIAKNRMRSNPFAFAKVEKTPFRRILFKKFPYKVFFRIDGEYIYLIALVHTKRSKTYIRNRLKK